jgi:hypothetical protein
MRKHIEVLVHPRYIGEERIQKREMVLKLSYDSVFYSLSTITAFVLFRSEYWFPSIVGGEGSCSQMYKEYPNWPSTKRTEL